MTHEQWTKERACLTEAVATASASDKRGLIETAFRRAIALLDDHPAALMQDRRLALAEAPINHNYDALGR